MSYTVCLYSKTGLKQIERARRRFGLTQEEIDFCLDAEHDPSLLAVYGWALRESNYPELALAFARSRK